MFNFHPLAALDTWKLIKQEPAINYRIMFLENRFIYIKKQVRLVGLILLESMHII